MESYDDDAADIGIIGGTGIINIELENRKEITMITPHGKPSDSIIIGKYKKRNIAFLSRHGREHTIPPHLINYKANVWAYKKLGIQRVIGFSSVGSLKKKIKPGELVLPSQFLDFTKSRDTSFSKIGDVIHISVAHPFCSELQYITATLATKQKITIHSDCVYTCIEGPRFSTLAESRFFQSIEADVIGMTLVPECQLFREVQICYLSISIVTDYDSWFKKTVTAKDVSKILSKNSKVSKKIISSIIQNTPKIKKCSCEKDLLSARL